MTSISRKDKNIFFPTKKKFRLFFKNQKDFGSHSSQNRHVKQTWATLPLPMVCALNKSIARYKYNITLCYYILLFSDIYSIYLRF